MERQGISLKFWLCTSEIVSDFSVVQVSDFGLTKFKSDIKKGGANGNATIHWTAPEVLNEMPDPEYILADVYSFGNLSILYLSVLFQLSQLIKALQASYCGSC